MFENGRDKNLYTYEESGGERVLKFKIKTT